MNEVVSIKLEEIKLSHTTKSCWFIYIHFYQKDSKSFEVAFPTIPPLKHIEKDIDVKVILEKRVVATWMQYK